MIPSCFIIPSEVIQYVSYIYKNIYFHLTSFDEQIGYNTELSQFISNVFLFWHVLSS